MTTTALTALMGGCVIILSFFTAPSAISTAYHASASPHLLDSLAKPFCLPPKKKSKPCQNIQNKALDELPPFTSIRVLDDPAIRVPSHHTHTVPGRCRRIGVSDILGIHNTCDVPSVPVMEGLPVPWACGDNSHHWTMQHDLLTQYYR